MCDCQWRDIGTAPKKSVFKDGGHTYGPKILGWDGLEVIRCRWWSHSDGSANFLMDGGRACYITHWQPLPPPPAEVSNG